MTSEGAAILAALEEIAQDAIAVIGALADEELNCPVPLERANTLFVLGTHLVGAAEYWVLERAGGHVLNRDRASEFEAAGSGAELVERFERWLESAGDVIGGMDAADFDRVSPQPAGSRSAVGDDDPTMTARDCLLHAVVHSATHVGEMQLTVQVLNGLPEAFG